MEINDFKTVLRSFMTVVESVFYEVMGYLRDAPERY